MGDSTTTYEPDEVSEPVVAFLAFLAAATDGDAVAAGLAEGLLAPWRPEHVTIYLTDPERTEIDAAGHYGLTADEISRYSRLPLELPVPLTEVVRFGIDGAWSNASVAERYPVVSEWVDDQLHRDTGEVLGIALRSQGRVIGVLALSFPHPPERTWRLRTTLDAAASAIAIWATPGPTRQPLALVNPRRRPREVQVTPRQREVLAMVGQSMTNAQIATSLGVSVGTVKGDLAHLFRLLGASTRADLVERAGRAGL